MDPLTQPDAPLLDEHLFDQRGVTGLRRFGGYVDEELLPALSGGKGIRVYREMSDNDSTVATVLLAFTALTRKVRWRVEPANETPEAAEWATFLEECIKDLDHAWEDFLSEVLTFLPYGWSWFETVYKLRRGPEQKDPRYRSAYNDGRYGWRKFAPRSQDSWERWEFSEQGDTVGMWQSGAPDYVSHFLPSSKSLHFRTSSAKNNPEGRSLLRGGYRSWWMLKRLQEIEAVGIERDLTGLPVLEVPAALLASAETRTAAQPALYNQLTAMVTRVRRHEREGVVVPSSEYTTAEGVLIKTGFKFSLLSTGGRRALDLRPAIEAYQRDIARTFLADFVFLGSTPNGTRSLADNKTDTFDAALSGFLDQIEETFHRQATSRLMALNGVPPDLYPRLRHVPLEKPELESVGKFVKDLVVAGALVPGPKLERHLRDMGDLPQEDPGLVDDHPMPVGDDDVRPDVPAPGEPPQVGAESVQDTALNGSQVTALVSVLESAAAGKLPREVAVATTMLAFRVARADADALVGEIGQGFVPAAPPAAEPPPAAQAED
jgi:hypothetical protein